MITAERAGTQSGDLKARLVPLLEAEIKGRLLTRSEPKPEPTPAARATQSRPQRWMFTYRLNASADEEAGDSTVNLSASRDIERSSLLTAPVSLAP